MNLQSYPFSKLPLPKLYQDYLSQKSDILSFFETNPFNEESIKKKANSLTYTGDRDELVNILTGFNERFRPTEKTIQNIESLSDDDSYTIVTGQQVTLFGGPLFTIYKVLTAIVLSERYKKKFNKNFIPVFWLADEDHDYEEISGLGIPVGESLKTISHNRVGKSERRVAEIMIDQEFEKFRETVLEDLPETDFSNNLRELLDRCYKPGNSFGDAFGRLLMSLFGKYGLVIAGSNSTAVKEYTKEVLITSIKKKTEIHELLNITGNKLEKAGYHQQVYIQESNLFWIDEFENRIKLQTTDGRWTCEWNGNTAEWTGEQLLDDIYKNPNRFSPNVLLRPLLQDELLPTVAYIGGPGEISYYAQMASMYNVFDKVMPVVLPRFSATIIESGIERIIEKLPFKFSDYTGRVEELESEYIEQTNAPDLEDIFSSWKEKVEEINNSMIPEIRNIDPTLENTAGKANAIYFTELDKLKGKLYKSVKQQETTQLNRISKIKQNLFPMGNLQEREVAFIYYMNKYGIDIWDDLFRVLNDEIPDTHKLLYL